MGLSKTKLDGKGKQSLSPFSFEKNLHGHRLANGFIHQLTALHFMFLSAAWVTLLRVVHCPRL